MNPWRASTFVLAAALVLALAHATARPAHADPQPRMRAALDSLQNARRQLQNATADKGGHRVKAIALTNEAIAEVRKGIEHDDER